MAQINAEVLAGITVANLLHPERGARLIQYHARDPQLPDFHEVLDALLSFTWKASARTDLEAEIQRVVHNVVLFQLMGLAVFDRAAPQVRSVALLKIEELNNWLEEKRTGVTDPNQKAHILFALSQIELFRDDPSQLNLPRPLSAPPGAPIGN